MFAHIIVSGFVQGVGYRQFVKKEAVKGGLKGWVKNIDNGRVEAGVTGEKSRIEGLVRKLRRGPFLAEVRDVKIEWEEKEPSFSGFEIIT